MKNILLSLGLCFCVFTAENSQASEPSSVWSFDDHPHPAASQMTRQENSALVNITKRSPDGDISCRASLQVEFEIYLDRYPEYLKVYDERERFKRWKRHLAVSPALQDLSCLYRSMRYSLQELHSSPHIGEDFFFCNGRYLRKPVTANEWKLVRFFEELLEYVHLASPEAAMSFVGANVYTKIALISPEMDYYVLSLALHKNPSERLEERRKIYENVIKHSMRTFFNEAARTGDYRKVVERLPGCHYNQSSESYVIDY